MTYLFVSFDTPSKVSGVITGLAKVFATFTSGGPPYKLDCPEVIELDLCQLHTTNEHSEKLLNIKQDLACLDTATRPWYQVYVIA